MSLTEPIAQVLQDAERVYTRNDIDAALDRMARAIEQRHAQSHLVCLAVMIGGLIPLGHLLTRLSIPLKVDYVHATRYQGRIIPGDMMHWRVPPPDYLEGHDVLIFDDVLDEGLTLQAIVEACALRKPRSIETAVLIDKPSKRKPEGLARADYIGLESTPDYIFGFGLDYEDYLRNLNGIYKLASRS